MLKILQEPTARHAVDTNNHAFLTYWLEKERWDGVLLGNLDLLGPELLEPLLASGLPLLHHIGFVTPPYSPREMPPKSSNYRIITASATVRDCLKEAGMDVDNAAVIYPGARVDLFGADRLGRPYQRHQTEQWDALCECVSPDCKWAAKGHTHCLKHYLQLKQRGLEIHAMLAGGAFQKDYAEQLRQFCNNHNLNSQIDFLPQLNRTQLARFFQLQHVCVFTSIHPEAFGIVAAEAMASGLALVSTGVGGASEVFEMKSAA